MPDAAAKSKLHISASPFEILPDFLYLGSYDNASHSELLKTLGISRVLNYESDEARVLVHCISGRNRSSVVMAYLMKSKGWKLEQNYQWLRECRPSVDLIQAVYQQLQEYEQKIFGSSLSGFSSSGVPSFSLGFPKVNDVVPAPAFHNLGATSIFAGPKIPPDEFQFGASHPPNNPPEGSPPWLTHQTLMVPMDS